MVAENLQFEFYPEPENKNSSVLEEQVSGREIFLDKELFLEVFENLVSNGARFAKSRLKTTINNTEEMLSLTVEDDGPGFSMEALHRGTDPFYGSEKDGRVHFGLGLYICKIICEKHSGELVLENRTDGTVVCGGMVTAKFGINMEK